MPFKSLALSQDIPGWVRAQDIAMDYDWTTLVGGHVGRLGVRPDGELQREYIRDLDASVRLTMSNLDPTPFFQQYGPSGNAWAIFAAYLDAGARQASAPIIDSISTSSAAPTSSRSTMRPRWSTRCAWTSVPWARSGPDRERLS